MLEQFNNCFTWRGVGGGGEVNFEFANCCGINNPTAAYFKLRL